MKQSLNGRLIFYVFIDDEYCRIDHRERHQTHVNSHLALTSAFYCPNQAAIFTEAENAKNFPEIQVSLSGCFG